MTPSAAASDMKMGMDMDHSNDPKKMAEHQASMALVAPGQATHVAKKSGSWFDRNTWEGGKIPDDKAKVLIKDGTSVTYDGKSDARLFTLNVSGELKFATNKDTKMVIDTFVVSSEGKLEIGTKGNPVKAGVKTEILIADNGAINRKWDPKQFSRGLISHGDVQIHGQDKTSHIKVSRDPMAGDNTLTLGKSPVNWQVGDTLVLTGTHFKGSEHDNKKKWNPNTEDEEVTIKSINGNRVTLEDPLKFNHDTPRGDLKAYVANKSRNVVIASENGDTLAASQRGHTMFMHSDDIDIRYVEFKDLGRTDKSKGLNDQSNVNGRYSAHIHQTGTGGKPAVLVGNVVDGSPGWGMVSHDSSAIFENNFAYDIFGGAFVTETGNETGAFRNNISIKTDGIYGYNEKSGVAAHDFGKSGIGFWFAGRLVENEGNVAAGARNAGMFYMHRGSKLIRPNVKDLPFPELGKERSEDGQTVSVDQAPIQGFKNNEVLASSVGLHVVKDFPQQHHDLRTVLDGFKGWEVERGTQMQYTSHYTLNDFDLIGAKDSRFWMNDGVVLQKNTQEFVFNKMTVDGFKHGILKEGDLGFGGPPELSDRGFAWIDLTLKNNEQDLKNLTLPANKRLKTSSLKKGQLKFEESGSDLLVTGNDFSAPDGAYVEIRGTKTDSLGTIEMPFGNERLSLNYYDVQSLAKKGSYELPDGSRGAIITEYFSDRVTGETIKQDFVVKFKEDWWTSGSPDLGKLNPASIGGNKTVKLPTSKFNIGQGPIKEVDPIKPTNPTPPTPEPENPDPVNPGPNNPDTENPDPVSPDPGNPTDPTNPGPDAPTDPVNPGPIEPSDPITPKPKAPVKPLQPSDTLKPSAAALQPVASYSFETGRGATVKDTSKAGRNNAGGLWNGVAWSDGVDGGGLAMDGTGSVRIKNSTDINKGIHQQRSISLWFKADQASGKNQVLYEEGGNGRGLNTYIDEEGLLYVGGWNRPGSQSNWKGSWIESGSTVTDGKWHHVAVVLDGTEKVASNALTAYLDGQTMGSDQGSQLWNHGDRIALGSIAGSTRFHDGVGKGDQGLVGSLDEAQIFNQALTGNQVKALASQF